MTRSRCRPSRPGTIPLRRLAIAAAAWAVSLTAASCSPETSNPASSLPFSVDVGCDDGVAAALEAWVDRGVGVSVVDVGGERQCVAAFGLADQETGRPNEVDTNFSIGSITKPITAAAIFDLIDSGLLSLDDTAGQHVANLAGLAGDSTIRNLLLHTSGLSGEHGFDHRPQTKSQAIASISNLEQASTPGTEFRYENSNYSILALIIDEVTEQGYRKYVVDEILVDRAGNPLNAGWWDGTPSPDGPRAWGYNAGTPARQRGDAPGPHWAMDGNGMMAMTPLVMAEWTYAFFNERVLSPEATQHYLATSTRLAGEGREIPGWAQLDAKLLGVPFFVTSGGGSGIGHEMDVAWLPESGRVIVVARNAVDHDVADFNQDVLPAFVVGTGIPTPPAIPESDIDLATMTGTYQVGDHGSIVIETNDGGLVISATGIEALQALYPIPDAKTTEAASQAAAAQQKLDAVRNGVLSGPEQRLMTRLVEDYGPLQGATLEGAFFEGRITEIATLEFRDQTMRAHLHTDLLGVTGFFPDVERPPVDLAIFAVATGDGFVERFDIDGVEKSVIRPVEGGVEIVSIAGTTFLKRER